MLTKDELSKVEHSVSHIQCFSYDQPNQRWYWLNEDGSAVEFLTQTGRKIQIPLQRATPEKADSPEE